MNLVTPISSLASEPRLFAEIVRASSALEARPEYLDVWDSSLSVPITHIHFSSTDLDLNFLWTENEWTHVARMVEKVGLRPLTLSFHISRDYREVLLSSENQFLPSGARSCASEMLVSVRENVAWIRANFPDCDVLVENNNFFPTGAYDIATDPDFLARVLEDSDLGLLFDVAHARVSAHNKHLDLTEYLKPLPLSRVKQIHLSKPRLVNGGSAADAHECPDMEDLRLLKDLALDLDLPLTVEYYRDGERLLLALQEISRWIEE